MKGILVKPFYDNFYPIMVEIGMIMFIYMVIILGYNQLRRPDMQQLIEKLKGYIWGYLLVKGAYVFVMYINKVIDSIKIN